MADKLDTTEEINRQNTDLKIIAAQQQARMNVLESENKRLRNLFNTLDKEIRLKEKDHENEIKQLDIQFRNAEKRRKDG